MITSKDLQSLSQAVPNLNKKAADQQMAAQRIQARGAAATAAPGQSSTKVAQTLAPAITQAVAAPALKAQEATGQQQLAGAQHQSNMQTMAGQQQLSRQGMQQNQQVADIQNTQKISETRANQQTARQITAEEQTQAEKLQSLGIEQDNKLLQLSLKQKADLQNLGHDLNDQLFDSRIRFGKDERGRKFDNVRQLADYAKLKAKDDQDFMLKMQHIQQGAKQKQLEMEAVHDTLLATLASDTRKEIAGMDSKARLEMQEAADVANRKASQAKSQAASIGNMMKGLVGGAQVGFMVGGPAGAVLGAGVGAVAPSIIKNLF